MFQLWMRFCLVGVLGSGVQTALLCLGRDWFGLHYLVATVVAVEAMLAHNFLWHEHWTWKTNGQPNWQLRAWKYQLTTGTIALLANLFAMRLLVGVFHLPTLTATLLAIAGSGAINFVLGQFLVFRKGRAAITPSVDLR